MRTQKKINTHTSPPPAQAERKKKTTHMEGRQQRSKTTIMSPQRRYQRLKNVGPIPFVSISSFGQGVRINLRQGEGRGDRAVRGNSLPKPVQSSNLSSLLFFSAVLATLKMSQQRLSKFTVGKREGRSCSAGEATFD